MTQLTIDAVGAQPDPEQSQWFTNPKLADRLVGLASSLLADVVRRQLPMRVLEPTAGSGALVRAVLRRVPWAHVDAVEVDERFRAELEETRQICALGSAELRGRVNVEIGDYLVRPAPSRRYDLAPCNLPFDDGEETAFLAKLLDEAERIPALLPARSLFGKDRYERVWWRFDAKNPDRDWYVRQKVHVVPRPKFGPGGGSDEIMLLDLRRAPGPCEVSW